MKPLKLTDISTSGLNLIEASAGTGKTWTIAALYIRLLLERNMKPEEVLVVTYTKAATSELKERIRRRIVDTLEMFSSDRQPVDELEEVIAARCPDRELARRQLTRALFSFDNAAVFTIHGFCQRALVDNAFESGSLFDTDMVTDQSAIVQEAGDDFWREFILTESDQFVARLVADRYTPEKLLLKLKGHYQNNDLKIIPQIMESDYSEVDDARSELFHRAAAVWRSESENISNLLKKPGLNKGSYKPQQIDKACTIINSWFFGYPYPTCEKLSFFSADTLFKKTVKGSTPPEHAFFELCRELVETCQTAEDSFQARIINLQHTFHEWLKKELPQRKRRANLRCYDDLLIDLHQALHGEHGKELAGSLRERYRAALIDEFQDTDSLQWQIFQRMTKDDSEHYPLFLIGDPKQAIYSFRGADIYAYLAAANSVQGEQCWTLETNRRSTSPLVNAVNRLFNAGTDPFMSDGIAFNPVKSGRDQDDQLLEDDVPFTSPLRFWIYPNSSEKTPVKSTVRQPVADAVAAEIQHLLNNNCMIRKNGDLRKLGAGDIAVLVKSHSQADLVNQTLTAAGIRSVQYGSMTIFETPESLDLLRLLRALANPGQTGLIRETMLGGLFGINANSLDEIMRNDLLWDSWLERFRELSDIFHHAGVVAMASCLLDKCGVRQSLLTHTYGERRLTNLLHCIELAHHASLENSAGIEQLIAWLEKRISTQIDDETALLRLETDDEAVKISTIHSSKGLQYPVVFLPFAWDARSKPPENVLFHDDDRNLTLDLGSENYLDNRQKSLAEQEAESMRLLYVAMTRAEFCCYVVWGAISQAEASPLYRLLHSKSGKPFKEYSDGDILSDIRAITQNAQEIEVRLMAPELSPHLNMTLQNDGPKLVCREFNGKIVKDWHISSFSSIVGGYERQLQPRDLDTPDSASINYLMQPAEPTDTLSIFDFPRGPEAGACLHELFEKLDYSSISTGTVEQLAKYCLLKNGYDQHWIPVVVNMAMSVINASLPVAADPGFSLCQLKPGSWVTEMEFYLPLKVLSSQCLKELFSDQLNPLQHGNFPEKISSLRMQESRGMLLGYIDMLFVYEGKYYIIDWKSNYLGHGCGNYGQEQLKLSMAEHAYILQYHLYTLAVDRLLALKISDYDYQKHFGGIFYIFLRGTGDGTGIYRDCPTPEFIRRANSLMLAEGS